MTFSAFTRSILYQIPLEHFGFNSCRGSIVPSGGLNSPNERSAECRTDGGTVLLVGPPSLQPTRRGSRNTCRLKAPSLSLIEFLATADPRTSRSEVVMQQEAGGEGAEKRLLAGRNHRRRAERRGKKSCFDLGTTVASSDVFLFFYSELEDIFGFHESQKQPGITFPPTSSPSRHDPLNSDAVPLRRLVTSRIKSRHRKPSCDLRSAVGSLTAAQ